MSTEKYAAIQRYLSARIPNQGIEQHNDFDLSAQAFKVHVTNDNYLLKVAEPFVEDHEIGTILQRLDQWNVIGVLTGDSDRIVFVGTEGVMLMPRD